jgi:hypothetical protein
MSRLGSGWRCGLWSLLLVCTISISASEDLGTIMTANPSSESLIVVAADDPDDDGEGMPTCASGSVGCTTPRALARNATDLVEPVGLNQDYLLRSVPRGPPDGGSRERGFAKAFRFRLAAVDAAALFSLLTSATPYQTSIQVEPGTNFSRNPKSSGNCLLAMDPQLATA